MAATPRTSPKPSRPRPGAPEAAPSVAGDSVLKLYAVPGGLLLLLAVVALGLWQLKRWDERRHVDLDVDVARAQTARRLERGLDRPFEAVHQLQKQYAQGTLESPQEFADQADALRPLVPELRAVALEGPDGGCAVLVPPHGDVSLETAVAARKGAIGIVIDRARRLGKTCATDLLYDVDRPDDATTVVAAPIANDEGRSLGTVVGRISVARALAALTDDAASRRDFLPVLFDQQGRVAYGNLPLGDAGLPPDLPLEPVHFLDREWRLALLPTPAFVSDRMTRAPLGVLVGGLSAAVLLTGIVYQAIRHRINDARAAREHVRQLGAVSAVAAAISGKLGSGREIMDQLTDAARQLLGMSIASIWMLDRTGLEIEIMSAAGMDAAAVGSRFKLQSLPGSRYCVETGRVADVPDVKREKRPLDWMLLDRFGIRSLLTVPLRSEGKVVGLMLIGDTRPRRFNESDLNLARLWGAQAAVILGNQRLYELKDAALVNQRRLLDQREVLYQVSASIYQYGSLDAALNKVAEVVPGALQVDVCTISLLSDKEGEAVQVATNDAVARRVISRPWRFSGRYAAALRERKMLVVEDAANDPLCDPSYVKQLNVGSIIYVPLVGENAGSFGMLVLIRHAAGKFEPEQLRMAEVFGARTAAAIETVRLYEQTRRDAETKAMLLRELNHRVKNNLAGIVGLLSANTPDLPPEAEQWLERATERIRMMARAHELFGGGMDRVSLAQLVNLMLPALSVIKPGGVEIRTDLDNVKVQLRTDRAVSLVMVLHELCYNAVVHGLADQGLVEIKARLDSTRTQMTIEVLDDGSATRTPAHSLASADTPFSDPAEGQVPSAPARVTPSGTGLGLNLVKGIVGRELKGRFRLDPRPEGGSIATLEFPLREEELTSA